MKPNLKFRYGFLATLALALFWELWASFDKDPSTEPLTWLVVTYIPAWIGLPVITLFAAWLVLHFKKNYKG